MATQRVNAIELTALDVSTSPLAWAQIGDALPEACSIIRLINESDVGVVISYDGGVTPHDLVLANDVLQLPVQGAPLPSAGNVYLFPKGLKIYGYPDAGGTGYIHLVGYYQK